MNDTDPDVKKEKELAIMINKMDTIMKRDSFIKRAIDQATANPNPSNV
jgi:hypothetical protein